MGIVVDHQIHPGVTPIADSIKHNDPFIPSPLMGSWVKFTVHLPRLLSDGQVNSPVRGWKQVYQMKEVETFYRFEAGWSTAVWRSEMS